MSDEKGKLNLVVNCASIGFGTVPLITIHVVTDWSQAIDKRRQNISHTCQFSDIHKVDWAVGHFPPLIK